MSPESEDEVVLLALHFGAATITELISTRDARPLNRKQVEAAVWRLLIAGRVIRAGTYEDESIYCLPWLRP